MSRLKNKNKKQIPLFVKLGVPVLTVALVSGLFIYKKYYQETPITPVAQNNPSTIAPQVLNNNNSSSVQTMHPKVVIPNKPGNVKELLTILANKSGLQIDWKLKGYYNLNAQEISQFNNPIGLILTPITDMMTLYNKELTIKWVLGNPGEPFPYPLNVMTLLCGKTLMLFELEDPLQIQTLLAKPDFKHCSVPDSMLGSVLLGPEVNQYDFTKPPPFLKPYDATVTQPQVTDSTKINEAKIDPKFTNETPTTPKLTWSTPTENTVGNGMVEFIPPNLTQTPNYPSPSSSQGASKESK